jgi:hypothetical protein
MIALAMCSITNAVILLMQDLLRLGSEAVLGLLRKLGVEAAYRKMVNQ